MNSRIIEKNSKLEQLLYFPKPHEMQHDNLKTPELQNILQATMYWAGTRKPTWVAEWLHLF